MQDTIRLLTRDDLPRLREFWVQHWGGEVMITRGQSIRFDEVEGFVYGGWTGLLTFLIRGDECEVTSLDSLEEGKGIGSALIQEIIREARERHCRRLFLITTNDNLRALSFYQKRGFELVTIRRGALNETRKLKPSVPLIGMNGIPLRDELELEFPLIAAS
ncbi:MAG: GNAT family N-acetyltransferase [Anaerolineales bacterium]|jgi:GNAT superfamily N-acetyltransferase|nr:GNAT family N-acetyltransferase [Anaerolineales bacterium]